MAQRKRMNRRIELSAAELALLAQSMTPVHKDEDVVVKGNQQGLMASVKSPAYARLPLHTVAKIILLAEKRELDTEYPEAMRFHKTGITGVFTAEPVAEYDESKTDLYQLVWADDKKSASVDLLPFLQPRNMQVAPGFVNDVPITVQSINKAEYLIFHFNEGELREEEEGPPRPRKKKGEAAKKPDTPNPNGAQPGQQSAAGENTKPQ